MDDAQFGKAIAYAADLGAEHGRNAASWYQFGGGDASARKVLQGIEHGDPAVLDTLPYADLSGQWADSLTGPALFDDAMDAAGVDRDDREDDATFSDICDAYETAFNDAAQSAIETAARSLVESEAETRAAWGDR